MNLDPKNLKVDYMRFLVASVMAQWVFALYSAVDGMFVARGVSEIALSAVNIASPFINFLFSLSLLFAAGTSTVAPVSSTRSSTWSERNASGASTTSVPVLETVMFVSRAIACACAVWSSNAPPSTRM